MYCSLNWLKITLDKNQEFYYFEPCSKNKIISKDGMFNIEKEIQEYEIIELFHTSTVSKVLKDALGNDEVDVKKILSWNILYVSYKNNIIDTAIIKVDFLSTESDETIFENNLLIINQGEISYSDQIIAQDHAPCGVLRKYKNTFIRDKHFEKLLIDK